MGQKQGLYPQNGLTYVLYCPLKLACYFYLLCVLNWTQSGIRQVPLCDQCPGQHQAGPLPPGGPRRAAGHQESHGQRLRRPRAGRKASESMGRPLGIVCQSPYAIRFCCFGVCLFVCLFFDEFLFKTDC